MDPRILALLSAVVPFITIQVTYLLSASYGHVDWCFPYVDSCTSISATGRQPPASYVFRATMLPVAVIMMGFWWLSATWIRNLQDAAGLPVTGRQRWMLVLGLLACMGLILYVTVLGEVGDVWRRQRRIGVVLFFSMTYLAQLLWVAQLRQLTLPRVSGLLRSMWLVCIALLATGLLTVVLELWNEAWYDTVEDAFEWVLALMLQSNFLLAWLVWRRMPWTLQVKAA
ncbi:conserved hypothetical protein [Luminiphilus syltensis NOR5-1B]|uniref:CWH43-like N-terminal domain-containing protein n=1 Tax=Luminiphilus syltensis NOR5-1B TaxID=565045 RepID=B8KXZ3_9GAMM|nr:hypothetical protein [Luminiphilus syltensis]EED35819.1 conserved hypothetical protein [Luminiphilus syltensis NOR5-1B]